jgi:hypothetical protein
LSFGFKNNKFIHEPIGSEAIGIKTKLVANPIMVKLAQNIARPLLSVVLGVELFCDRV